MKQVLILSIFLALITVVGKASPVQASPVLPPEVVDAVDLSSLKDFLNTIDEDVQLYLPR